MREGWLTIAITQDIVATNPTTERQSSLHPVAPLETGVYQIVNRQTDDHAALLDANAGSAVVTILSRLLDQRVNVDQVRDFLVPDHSYSLSLPQWSIKHLKQDTYRVQNITFGSYAGHKASPKDGEDVIGKSHPDPWVIKAVDGSRYHTSVTAFTPLLTLSLIDLQDLACKQCRHSVDCRRSSRSHSSESRLTL